MGVSKRAFLLMFLYIFPLDQSVDTLTIVNLQNAGFGNMFTVFPSFFGSVCQKNDLTFLEFMARHRPTTPLHETQEEVQQDFGT